MPAFSFFLGMANDNLFVVYGIWLENRFGLGLAAIGMGTVFIGLSEILGEMLTVFFSDRIGLRRAMRWGTAIPDRRFPGGAGRCPGPFAEF